MIIGKSKFGRDTIGFHVWLEPSHNFTTPRPTSISGTSNPWQFQRWWKNSDHNYIDMRYARKCYGFAAEASAELQAKPATKKQAGYLNQAESVQKLGRRKTGFPEDVSTV